MSADLADIGHDYWSVNYNVPTFTYLLETEIFSIVEYQLKCCSVANDAAVAAPDCHLVWSGVACCRQGHQRVAWTAAPLCKSWWTTLRSSNICSEPQTSLFGWFYCFMTLLRLRHALKLLLALQGTVATHKARFGGLSDVKVSLQNSSGMCLLKIIKLDGTWQTCTQ